MFRDQAKYSFKRKIHPLIAAGLVLAFLVSACMKERPPADLLTEEQMVKVLMEIYIMEDKTGRAIVPSDSLKKVFPIVTAEIFNHVGVPDSVFKKSMEYYMANPKKMEHIYTALVDSLSLKVQSAPAVNVE